MARAVRRPERDVYLQVRHRNIDMNRLWWGLLECKQIKRIISKIRKKSDDETSRLFYLLARKHQPARSVLHLRGFHTFEEKFFWKWLNGLLATSAGSTPLFKFVYQAFVSSFIQAILRMTIYDTSYPTAMFKHLPSKRTQQAWALRVQHFHFPPKI